MDTNTDTNTATNDMPQGDWVLLEVFGHRRHWGLISEIERFGTKMARIDEYRPGEAEPVRTHFYGGASIFSITSITEEMARRRIAHYDPPAVQTLAPPDEAADLDDDRPV